MLLLLAALVAAAAANEQNITFIWEKDVAVMEPWVHDSFRADFKSSMILIYGKGCGSCQWMMGAYERAAQVAGIKNLPFKFAKMGAFGHDTFTKGLGAKGFPHIHVFGPGYEFGYKYTGEMKTEAFIREMMAVAAGKKTVPKITVELSNTTYKDFIGKPLALVLFSSHRDDNDMPKFIDNVIHELKTEGESILPVGILNITTHKGVAPAEEALEQVQIYRRGIAYQFFPQTDITGMKKELVRRMVLSSQEITAATMDDSGLKTTYLDGSSGESSLIAIMPGRSLKDMMAKQWLMWCYTDLAFNCAHSFDRKFAAKYQIKKPSIVWRRPNMWPIGKGQFPETILPVPKDLHFVNLFRERLKVEQLPLVADFDMADYNNIYRWNANTVVVCYFHVNYQDNLPATQRWLKRIASVASKFWVPPLEDKTMYDGDVYPIRFAIADEIANDDQLQKSKLLRDDEDDDPIIIIHNTYNHTIHHPSQEEQMEKNMKFETYLEQLVRKYIAGDLPAYLMGQPVPIKQTVPIMTVVRDTIMEVVMDESKDVFVFFTAEDCAECSILMNWLVEIHNDFKDSNTFKMVQMDIGKNEVDRNFFSYQKAPYLYMVPGGKKPKEAEHYPYSMDKSPDTIKGFIGSKATLTFSSCPGHKKPSIEDVIKPKAKADAAASESKKKPTETETKQEL